MICTMTLLLQLTRCWPFILSLKTSLTSLQMAGNEIPGVIWYNYQFFYGIILLTQEVNCYLTQINKTVHSLKKKTIGEVILSFVSFLNQNKNCDFSFHYWSHLSHSHTCTNTRLVAPAPFSTLPICGFWLTAAENWNRTFGANRGRQAARVGPPVWWGFASSSTSISG